MSLKKGKTYGHLTVIKLDITSVSKTSGRTYKMARCRCICDKIIDVRASNLESSRTKSCGCMKYKNKRNHGLSKHPLYIILNCMNNRCTKPNNKFYKDYGGRGIRVCDDWLIGEKGALNFIAWNNSLKEEDRWKQGLQIERKNNNGDYEPSNCRWATSKEQANNKRDKKNSIMINHKGKKYTIAEFYEKYNTGLLSLIQFRRRIMNGIAPVKSITRPMNSRSR